MNIPRPKRRLAAIAAAMFLGCLCGSVFAQDSEPAEPSAPPAEERPVKQIKMTAENWKWSPDVIRVKQGTRVVIAFDSYDASHSFELKAYKIKVPLPEGKTGQVEFVAHRSGEFSWRCGRPCGDGCAKMRGKLIVEE